MTITAGFPTELRRWRNTRRLSQLELAGRAGTTQRHLSYLEQGRSRPGRQVVIRLADSLELNARERNSLLVTAGFVPAFPESSLDVPALRPVLDALRRIIDGHLPYPALVAGPRGDLVAANAAFDVLTEGADADLLEPPINVLRLAMHPRGMGRRVVNLTEWGRHIVANARGQALRHPDPRLEELVEELRGYLPADRPEPDGLGFAAPLRLRTAAGELRLLTTLTSFATATDVTLAELHLEAFLPADDRTAELLVARATRSPGSRTPSPAGARS